MQVQNRPAEQGTHARPRARIRLRGDRLNVMTGVLGASTDVARGQLLGVDPKTIRRARAGTIGEELIARTLASLGDHAAELARYNLSPSFDELFVVDTSQR